MRRNVNRQFSAITALLAGATIVTAIAAPTQSAPADNAPAPALLPRGPIAVYDGACARCHGPNGSFYGPTLGQGKTDDQLRAVIREMAEGPGNETLAPQELEAQTAYHRALILKEPFVVVTARKENTVEGEVTPNATISVRRKDTDATAETAAKIDGSHWSLEIPGLKSTDALIITAKTSAAATRLDTSQQAWSHTQPLPAPQKEKATG